MKQHCKKMLKARIATLVFACVATCLVGFTAAYCFWNHRLISGVIDMILMVVDTWVVFDNVQGISFYKTALKQFELFEEKEG